MKVTHIQVSPNGAGVKFNSAITVNIDFTLPTAVEGWWEFKYVVDVASCNVEVALGSTSKASFCAGPNSVSFSAASIPTSSAPDHALDSVGLLVASSFSEIDGAKCLLYSFNMVTQVTRREVDGQLLRIILDPGLEKSNPTDNC